MIRAISGVSGTLVFKLGAPVSIVCVAATYTGVTYANNGGKVQLSSAGVHGLTTSPAVGASVYVSWASGTGYSGLYPILSIDDTLKITIEYPYAVGLGSPTVAVANTEISVQSITVPPLSLNSFIKIMGSAVISPSSNYKTITFFWGGSGMVSNQTSSATMGLIRIDGWMRNYSSTSSQKGSWLIAPGSTHSNTDYRSASVDTSLSSILNISLRASAANEKILLASYLVEVFI